jgi:hypothetical protein
VRLGGRGGAGAREQEQRGRERSGARQLSWCVYVDGWQLAAALPCACSRCTHTLLATPVEASGSSCRPRLPVTSCLQQYPAQATYPFLAAAPPPSRCPPLPHQVAAAQEEGAAIQARLSQQLAEREADLAAARTVREGRSGRGGGGAATRQG